MMGKSNFNIVNFTGYQGEMTKKNSEMTPVELLEWEKEINQKIRKNLFAINMPLVHKHNGRVVAEMADGTMEIIR